MAVYALPAFAQSSAVQPAPNAVPPPPKVLRHKPLAPALEPTDVVSGDTKPTLLGRYGDWGAYSASSGGKKICFVSAKPSSSETDPPGKSRNPTFIFISSRPAERVNNEISITMGYPFQPRSEATLGIGSVSFALATRQDGAWIKNPVEQPNLIEAMRGGQNAVLKAKSAKGTQTTDIFALNGLRDALDRSARDCK
jgi:Invasion associated locus B (IalB) protein